MTNLNWIYVFLILAKWCSSLSGDQVTNLVLVRWNKGNLPPFQCDKSIVGTMNLNVAISQYCQTHMPSDEVLSCINIVKLTTERELYKSSPTVAASHYENDSYFLLNTHKHVYNIENNALVRINVGMQTHGVDNIIFVQFGEPNAGATIGRYVHIGPNVSFYLGGNHQYRRAAMFPFESMLRVTPLNGTVENFFNESYSRGPILVGINY